MGNKRVSQLVELTTAEVQSDDLLLIIDTTARESKKIQIQNLSAYLNVSGSIDAAHAEFADTASYVLPGGINWTVPSSSFSTTTISSSFASNANNSINSISSSYAQTSSWAINVVNGAGSSLITGSTYPITSSWANNTNVAKSASFLIYNGFSNGTASYAISANTSIFAATASFFAGVGSLVTASYAIVAETANVASIANSASYLIFSPNNGTASYALTAGTVENKLRNFGVFLALSQSVYQGVIDNLNLESSLGTPQLTVIEAFGTAILNYTASVFNATTMSLISINRLTGQSSSLDRSQFNYDVSYVPSAWNTLSTGSLYIPFTLVGEAEMLGNYYVAITSSNNLLKIDSFRPVKFTVSSYADIVSSLSDRPLDFYINPSDMPITFSSFAGGPFYDLLPGFLASGSSNALTIDISNSDVTNIFNTWKCYNLQIFSCSNSPNIQQLTYTFPNPLTSLYCDNCNINTIADLSNTKLVTLNCNRNLLSALPNIPNTVKYLNCANNDISNLTNSFSPNLISIITDNNPLQSISNFNSQSLITASFNNCQLTSLPNPLPTTLRYLSTNNNWNLSTLPDLSLTSASYVDVSFCDLIFLSNMSTFITYIDISSNISLPNISVVNCTNQLVANALPSGTFKAWGYPPDYTTAYYGNLLILQNTYNWAISASGFP